MQKQTVSQMIARRVRCWRSCGRINDFITNIFFPLIELPIVSAVTEGRAPATESSP